MALDWVHACYIVSKFIRFYYFLATIRCCQNKRITSFNTIVANHKQTIYFTWLFFSFFFFFFYFLIFLLLLPLSLISLTFYLIVVEINTLHREKNDGKVICLRYQNDDYTGMEPTRYLISSFYFHAHVLMLNGISTNI